MSPLRRARPARSPSPPAAVGFPLRQDTKIFGTAFRSAVFAQQHVAPAAQPIWEGDDSLTALLVETIGGDGRLTEHATCTLLRKSSAHSRVSGRTVQHEQVRLTDAFG
jgi:hypothetical protein